MKKVLLVSNMYPSKKNPHYGVFVQNMENILLEENIKVSKSVLQKSTNKVIKLLSYVIFYGKTTFKGLFGSYDCIYAHYASHTALPLLIIKKIKPKTKIVMNVHGNDIVPEDKKDKKYLSLVVKILNCSDKIVSPSKYFEEILINEYNIQVSKIFVSPSGGVDAEVFAPVSKLEAKKKNNLDETVRYIGYVSRIEKDKGWDILLYAIDQIRNSLKDDIKFLFVGSGSQDEEFNKLVEKLELENMIIKLAFFPQKDLKNIYSSLDFFVFPTYRKSESLGLVGLEAMACETLVLASDMGGPKTYIKDGINGILFKSKNSKDLANKIVQILNIEPKLKNDIKKNARATALCYEKNKVKKEFIEKFVQWI